MVSMLFVHLHIATIVQDVFLIAFHRIGPSEFRMMGVAFVLLVMYAPGLLLSIVLTMIFVVLGTLIVAIYTTQRTLGRKDMENKKG